MEWAAWSTDELGAWTQAWVEGFVGFLAVATLAGVLVLVVALALATCGVYALVRRRFWCPDAGRDVEVEFWSRGLTRRPAGVVSCTAFEPVTAIACGRGCIDATARERCQPPPVIWRAGGA